MKNATVFIMVLMGGMSLLKAQELGDLRWQHRILLLMNPNENPLFDQQLKLLRGHTPGFQERDLLLFIYDGLHLLDERGQKSPIGVKEVPNPSFEGVILIGKDGGVKWRKPFPVTARLIFDRIDSMPMRKAEMPDEK